MLDSSQLLCSERFRYRATWNKLRQWCPEFGYDFSIVKVNGK
jgi:hypothetical protein